MQRFKNILLVLGKSGFSSNAAQNAIQLARSNNARLTAIDVLSRNSGGYRYGTSATKQKDIDQLLIRERQKEIEQMLKGADLDIEVALQVFAGKKFIEIIQCVQSEDIDIVIKDVGEDKGFAAMFFGSNDLRLLRKCPCPVWLVKSEAPLKNQKILAAVELEAIDNEGQIDYLNKKIVEIASSMSHQEGSELHIVNAWIVFEGGSLAKKLSKKYREDIAQWIAEQRISINKAQTEFREIFEDYLQEQGLLNLDYTFHFPEGIAEEVIVDLAERLDINLIVMGTVARTDLAGLLVGNTSEAILNQIKCSVMAIKPPGFVSPVQGGNR